MSKEMELLNEDWGLFKHYSTHGADKGALLLANPLMDDPNFKRAVVQIVEHNDEGAVGFIVNKPLQIQLQDIMDDFAPFNTGLFFGGPVQLDSLHFIHDIEGLEGSTEVASGLFWGGDLKRIQDLARFGGLQQDDVRFFVGYAGWTSGQLASEFDKNSWIACKSIGPQLLHIPPDDLWQHLLRRMGALQTFVSNIPENPRFN